MVRGVWRLRPSSGWPKVADAVSEAVAPSIPRTNNFVSNSDGGHMHRGQRRVLSWQEQGAFEDSDLIPTVCLSNIPLVYCHINSFQRASRLARPSQGGEKRTAVWASRHEGLVSHDGVAPHVCDPMLVPQGWAVLERGNPWGSAGDAGLDTAAQARRAARAVDGGVVSVP